MFLNPDYYFFHEAVLYPCHTTVLRKWKGQGNTLIQRREGSSKSPPSVLNWTFMFYLSIILIYCMLHCSLLTLNLIFFFFTFATLFEGCYLVVCPMLTLWTLSKKNYTNHIMGLYQLAFNKSERGWIWERLASRPTAMLLLLFLDVTSQIKIYCSWSLVMERTAGALTQKTPSRYI